VENGKHIAFSFFKKEFLGRIEILQKEELFLESLGPLFVFSNHFNMGTKKYFPTGSNAVYADVVDVKDAWVELGRGM
jgi:hypothetical protein